MNSKTRIILDTDIGYDPDDLFALLLLEKLAHSQIELIITANEINNKRLKFLSQALKQVNGNSINIVAGSSLGLDKFTVDSILNSREFDANKDSNFVEQMASVVKNTEDIIYIGIGGFTNLAKFVDAYPNEAKRMKIFLMGGSLDYERYPGWVEYNIRIDPGAAEKVISSNLDLTLVMAQTTHNPIYEVTQNSSIYKKFQNSPLAINKLLLEHCDLWFKKREFKHGTSMHDPLTIATALGYDFVNINKEKVIIKDSRFVPSASGYNIKYTEQVSKAKEFMDFLEATLL